MCASGSSHTVIDVGCGMVGSSALSRAGAEVIFIDRTRSDLPLLKRVSGNPASRLPGDSLDCEPIPSKTVL